MNTPPPLMEHQKTAVSFIADKDAFALFMEQGTGKSRVIIEKWKLLMQQAGVTRLLVIAPNAVKAQWTLEVPQVHLGLDEESYQALIYRSGWGTRALKSYEHFLAEASRGKPSILAIHYEAFSYESAIPIISRFTKGNEIFVVLDESTDIKDPDALRSKRIVGGFAKRKYKALLTGTPVEKGPVDLWNQFQFLQPNVLPRNFFEMRRHHSVMITVTNPHTGRPISTVISKKVWEEIRSSIDKCIEKNDKLTPQFLAMMSMVHGIKESDLIHIARNDKYSPYKNLDELKKQIAPITYTVKKSECGLDLPEKIYQVLRVEPTKEQRHAMSDMKKLWIAEYGNNELTAQNALAAVVRMQQIASGITIAKTFDEDPIVKVVNSPKVEAVIKDMQGYEGPVIIWARFRAEAKYLHGRLEGEGYTVGSLNGDTPPLMRESLKDGFRDGSIQVLVISPTVGGKGLDFPFCELQYFLSQDTRAIIRNQCEDRSHRIGLRNNVVYKDVYLEGSLDEDIGEILKQKGDIIDYFRSKPVAEWTESDVA